MKETSKSRPTTVSNYRHKKILEMLYQRKSLSADELAAEFGVSRAVVREAVARLKADGLEVLSGPRTTGDGYYESCIAAIEGNQIELTV